MKKLASLFLGLVVFCGCITIPPVGGEYKYNLKEMLSYGVDNHWMDIDPMELASNLRKNGLTMTSIEFFGCNPSSYSNPSKLKDKYKKFVRAMRLYKIVTFISLTNDNKGSGKYGDDGKGLNYYKVQIRQALDIVIAEGSEGVIVQPVAETYTSEGSKFEAEAIQKLKAKGFKTCWNHGSRPNNTHGCSYFAYHPASTKDVGAANGITITDHGLILKELNNGNVYGYGNPQKVGSYAQKVHASGRGFGYYGFGHTKIDTASIEAIGKNTKVFTTEMPDDKRWQEEGDGLGWRYFGDNNSTN